MLNKLNISSKKQTLIVYILLIVTTLAVYWQVNQFDFINFDDPMYVTENVHIQSGITLDGFRWAFSTKYTGLWNPLVWLSLMFDYQLYGLNAGGYHLTNLILHIMSALLLFWLFNRMTGAIWRSAFIAAFFALHPLHVESVAWITERKDVLSAFFWMLTLCLYAYYTEKPVIKRYLLVLFPFVCALMSKPMVVTLPVIMILLDYWPLNRLQKQQIGTNMTEAVPVSTNQERKETKSKKGVLKKNIYPSIDRRLSETKIAGIIQVWQLLEKIPFFILSAALVIVTLYNPNNPTTELFSLSSRMANAIVAFMTYLEKTFWPHDLAIFYPFSTQIPAWQVIVATLLILSITSAVIVTVKRMPYLFVGWLWYAITILPVIGIIQISLSAPYAMADRYTYLPSIGISIMLAWGIPFLIKREEIRNYILFPAGLVFLAILSFLTWQQCGYWKNSTTLFSHALQVTKNNDLAHYNLGMALDAEGKKEEAIPHYLAAIKINPAQQEAHSNLGVVLAAQGRNEEAVAHYLAAIKINPNYADAYYNLANLLIKHGKMEEAIDNYRKVIKINPDHFEAHCNLADVFVKQNKLDQAIEHFREAVRINPYSFTSLNNLGVNLERQLKHEEAIYYYRQAMLIEPKNPGIHFNLGVAFGNKGDLEEAAEHFRQAINLKPDFEDARRALKLALEMDQ
jgi:tetratricopeptide (TPR) repeat protein